MTNNLENIDNDMKRAIFYNESYFEKTIYDGECANEYQTKFITEIEKYFVELSKKFKVEKNISCSGELKSFKFKVWLV